MDRRLDRPRAWRRPRVLLIAAGVLTGLAALSLFILAPASGALRVEAQELRTSTAAAARFQEFLPVRAEVTPARTVILGAVSGGQVERLLVVDGAQVTAGQELLRLSNPQLTLEVSRSAAEITARISDTRGEQLSLQANRAAREREIAAADFATLKSAREFAARTKLHAAGIVSDAELKTYAEEDRYNRERLAALKAGGQREDRLAAEQATAINETSARLRRNLRDVEASLAALTVKAPVGGRLTNFTLEAGQAVKVGDPLGQIDSEGDYKLVAQVDEYYLGRIGLGDRAAANLNGVSLPVRVSRVLPQVTDGRFKIELLFAGSVPGDLRRGQSLDVRLNFGGAGEALVVENGPWLEAGGGAFAYVVGRNGRSAERRPIKVGRRNPEQVEVLEGLKPGERVVTSSYAGFEKFNRLIIEGQLRK